MRKRTKKSIVAAAGLTTALTGLVAVHHAEPLGVLGGGHNKALATAGRELSDEAVITMDAKPETDVSVGYLGWKDFSMTVDLTGKTIKGGDSITLKFGPLFSGSFYGIGNGSAIRTEDGTSIGFVRINTITPEADRFTTKKSPEWIRDHPEEWKNLVLADQRQEVEYKVIFNKAVENKTNVRFTLGTNRLGGMQAPSNKPREHSLVVTTASGRELFNKKATLPAWYWQDRTAAYVFFDSRKGIGPGGKSLQLDWHTNSRVPLEAGQVYRTTLYDSLFSIDPTTIARLKATVGKEAVRTNFTGAAAPQNDGLLGYPRTDGEFRVRLESVSDDGRIMTWKVLSTPVASIGMHNSQGLIMASPEKDWIALLKHDGTPLNPLDADLYNENGQLKNARLRIERFAANDTTLATPIEDRTLAVGYRSAGAFASATGETVKQRITVRFVDSKTGQELKTEKAYLPFRGDSFSVPEEVLSIEGKTLINPNDARIERVNDDATITLRYEDTVKNSNVSVLVVDEAGKTIRPNSTVFSEAKPEGTAYTVRKPRIAGYRFVRAEGELAGTLGKTDKTVKLVYKTDSSVVAGTDPDSIEERKESVVPIPFETETRDNPELWQGEERVVNPGAEGSKTVITTRQLDENQQPVGDPVVTENVTKQPVKRVIERGTKNPDGTETVTTEKPKPFKTETLDNPDLYEGEERVVTEGKDGVTTVTTVYKTNKGKRTGDNPTVTEKEKQPPVNRVVERGTKDPNGIDLVKEHEDVVYKTEYRDNPELYEGETRVIQEGELGSNVVTKQYKTKKGKRTDEEPVVTKTTEKEPRNRIIERGTKPVAGVDTIVEDKELPFKLVVKDNPELTEGEERVVTEGAPGLVKKTTVYKTEKGKRVGDPTVTETVIKEPIDRVVEKGIKPKTPKQTDADKNNPKGKDQTVFVGEKPDPKNSIDNYNDLPEGTIVKFEKDPDTATPGQKPSILLFEYPDGSVERVSVIVTAIPKPEPKDQTVFVGETPKAEDSIGNYPQLPEGTRVSWLVPPKTDKPGVVDGVVLIEYPDGRRVEVPVRVTVVEKEKEKEKEKQPPQQEQKSNSENGNNNDKDKVSEDSEKSDNSDNSDKDSNKDKTTPQGKDQTVKVGDNPLVQDSIVNHKDLPKGTKLSWEKTPDTTKPGVIEAVVLVEYPDGTREKVTVRITVVDDSDKNKEKNNHENGNKPKSDNQTPDKKEQSENKQPDRKESIKTGVGSVDQTAAGVAITATALALSAFALRRRKQQ